MAELSVQSNTVWTEAYQNTPAGSDTIASTDDQIRALKTAVMALLSKEHQGPDTNESQVISNLNNPIGRLRQGSATAFWGPDVPTSRADGTVFDDRDLGKTWWKTTYKVDGDWAGNVRMVSDGRFGLYWLAKDVGYTTTNKKYCWVPAVGNDPIGTVKQWVSVDSAPWVDPTPNELGFYTTGTMPGWVRMDGLAHTIPQERTGLPIGVRFDMRDAYLRFGVDGSAPANVGGTVAEDLEKAIPTVLVRGDVSDQDAYTDIDRNGKVLSKSELPPHDHATKAGNLKLTADPAGKHSHTFPIYDGLSGVKRAEAGASADHVGDPSTSEAPDHSHTISQQAGADFGKTETTDGTDTAFGNSKFSLRPRTVTMFAVVRMY